MSTVPLTIRGETGAALVGGQGCPVVGSTARALLPASMAGLPVKRAMVWVGPPLFCNRRAEPGSATPTWLPLMPLTRPPEPPVPIRLSPAGNRAGDVAGRRSAASAVGIECDDRIVQGGPAGKTATCFPTSGSDKRNSDVP